MTLPEVMISMVLLAMVMAAVFGVLFRVQVGVERQIDRAEVNQREQLVSQAIDREVRSSYNMNVTNSGTGLVVFTATNSSTRGGDSCAQFKVVGGNLLHRWWLESAPPVSKEWGIVSDHVTASATSFDVPTVANAEDPTNLYGESLLNVSLTITGAGSAPGQIITQAFHGDNVAGGETNPCEDPGVWPA